jgi:hypothetical protein
MNHATTHSSMHLTTLSELSCSFFLSFSCYVYCFALTLHSWRRCRSLLISVFWMRLKIPCTALPPTDRETLAFLGSTLRFAIVICFLLCFSCLVDDPYGLRHEMLFSVAHVSFFGFFYLSYMHDAALSYLWMCNHHNVLFVPVILDRCFHSPVHNRRLPFMTKIPSNATPRNLHSYLYSSHLTLPSLRRFHSDTTSQTDSGTCINDIDSNMMYVDHVVPNLE